MLILIDQLLARTDAALAWFCSTAKGVHKAGYNIRAGALKLSLGQLRTFSSISAHSGVHSAWVCKTYAVTIQQGFCQLEKYPILKGVGEHAHLLLYICL